MPGIGSILNEVSPGRNAFNAAEWRLIQRLKTPQQVQRYLAALRYNWEENGSTLRSFRGVVKAGRAHCLEAALFAAAVLEQHGYPPLLLDLESVDKLDHVLFLFRGKAGWGTVARSRDAGLHGRKPVFRTVFHLVQSYVDTYIDGSGRLIGFGTLDLRSLTRCDWRFSLRNVRKVERALIHMPHRKFSTSERRFRRALRKYQEFRRAHPEEPATYYENRHLWL